MTRTKEITLYKFSELSDDAKDKAIEWYAGLGLDHEWWDCIYDDAERIGLKITSFDLNPIGAEGKLLKSVTDVCNLIIANHGTSCDTYQLAQKYLMPFTEIQNKIVTLHDDDKNCDDLENERDDMETEFEMELLGEYASLLNREYQYQMSREVIIENIEANEYDFNKDGEIE